MLPPLWPADADARPDVATTPGTSPPERPRSPPNASPKLPAAQIRDLAALCWLHSGESVILFGPVGVGKTHVAQALGHQAIRQGANVRFTKTSRILA
ncbi:ATP-binding protein [Streptomyces sp. NPDC057375]|uniref:ATP-binding protein n=1 Tax=Streptomyces sp. NPDC057375 TaxID=3346109 RepID=UPI00363C8B8F